MALTGSGTSLRFATDANASRPVTSPAFCLQMASLHLQRGDQTKALPSMSFPSALQERTGRSGAGRATLTFSNDNRLVSRSHGPGAASRCQRATDANALAYRLPPAVRQWRIDPVGVKRPNTTTPASGALDYNGTGLAIPFSRTIRPLNMI